MGRLAPRIEQVFDTRMVVMRFIAAHHGGIGDHTFAVWDVIRQEWRTRERVSSEAAEALAAELNLRFSAAGARPESHRRTLDPPHAVEINLGLESWRPGQLRYWVRESAGWLGYAHVEERGESAWYPAERLRLPT